jgi:ParB family chromosome partitioning protein
MRLLKLPAQIQIALKNKDIDMGHARALLSIDSPSTQLKLFKEVQRNGYSVRKVEEMVQKLKNGETIQSVKKSETQLPLEYSILRDRLSELFKVKVQMTCSSQGKGKISIPFINEDELEYVMNIFDKIKN